MDDLVGAILRTTDGGVDYPFQCIGNVNPMRQRGHNLARCRATSLVLVEAERAYE